MSMRSPHWRWAGRGFLLLEQFSNGVNTYTRGNGSGTSRKNDTVGYLLGFKDRPESGSPGQMYRCAEPAW